MKVGGQAFLIWTKYVFVSRESLKKLIMNINRQKDTLKKNGIFVDGQTYSVKFKGRGLKLDKWWCCFFSLSCTCLYVWLLYGRCCGPILSLTPVVLANLMLGEPCKGIAPHGGEGGKEEIPLVASCNRNPEKLERHLPLRLMQTLPFSTYCWLLLTIYNIWRMELNKEQQ